MNNKFKSQKKSCKDVFNEFLVSAAHYSGIFEFPVIRSGNWIPNRLISFSKAVSCKDYDQWIHFYEFDYKFERIWNRPKRYVNILKKFNGVILPDFSVYRDMPFVMQLWNIYRSRAIGCWLQNCGIKVIPNIRWGDIRTSLFCCDGIVKNSVIAVGSNGAIGNSEDRKFFTEGLDVIVQQINPMAIVVYGSAPEIIFSKYRDNGIKIIQFDCEFTSVSKEVK